MPASTTIETAWNIDYVNKILSHKDQTVTWDSRTAGTSPNIGDYVRDTISGAVGKVISGSGLGTTDATGTMVLTNVRGIFANGNQLDVEDTLGFDNVEVGKGFVVGEQLDAPTTEEFVISAVEFNYGVSDGTGIVYGDVAIAGFLNDDQLDNATQVTTSVAQATGAEVDNSGWDGDVNVVTATTISGILNYDTGTVDIPNDALVLAGERATGDFDVGANPLDTETVVLGSTTYTFNTTLGGANSVLIGASPIASLRNLVNAINFGAGIGTAYGLGTVKNTLADMGITDVAGVVGTARTFIPSTTATTSTTTVTGATWTSATLDTGASGSTGRGRSHARTIASVTATGSYITNDIDGTWTENEAVFIDQILQYDTVEAGQAFAVGDVVQGQTSGAQGRVLAVTSSRLILAEQTLRYEEDESIHRVNIDQTTTDIADVTTDITHADEITSVLLNHPNSQPTPRVIQKEVLQGGIFTASINPVRHVRQLYNFLQDKFDETDQMDDTIPMSGQVKNAQYTLINGWFIPDDSMRFLDSGSIRDSTSDNIWANPQSLGSLEAVGNTGYSARAVQPQLYVEQDGVFVVPADVPSLEGQINLLIKIKKNTDTRQVVAVQDGTGVSIDSGRIRVYNRFYLHTYSHFFTANNDTGGVVTIALASANDLNNTTETYDIDYDAQSSATAWVLGDEIVNADSGTLQSVGVVVSADVGATGNIQYVLKSGHQFADNDVITNQFIQNNKTAFTTLLTVVAGYSSDIGFGHVDSNFTGDTTTGTFQIGEGVTQTGTSAIGIILEDDAGTTLYIDELDVETNAWNGTGLITGDLSGATYTPTTRTADTVAPKDIGDEVDNDYTAIFALDKTVAVPAGLGATIQQLYEYTKFIVSKEADSVLVQKQGARNQDTDVEGRIYRKVDQVTEATPAFAEQVDAPYGIKAGALFLGAQSVFVQDMATADIQNYNLVDDAGTAEVPPNLQAVQITGLAVGDKAVTYRTTGVASVTILTTEFQVGTVGGGNNETADSTIDLDSQTDAIPMNADTPPTGTLRVIDPNNAGLFLNFTYGSRNKTTGIFTLDTTAEQPTPEIGDVTSSTSLGTTDDAYVVLLSKTATASTESVTIEFALTLDIMTRVRKRGILPFEVTGQFTSSGASIATIRTTDPVVDPV